MKFTALLFAVTALFWGLSHDVARANHTAPAVCSSRLLTRTRASADCWGGPHWVRVIARQSNGVTRKGPWMMNDDSQVYAVWPYRLERAWFEVILP